MCYGMGCEMEDGRGECTHNGIGPYPCPQDDIDLEVQERDDICLYSYGFDPKEAL